MEIHVHMYFLVMPCHGPVKLIGVLLCIHSRRQKMFTFTIPLYGEVNTIEQCVQQNGNGTIIDMKQFGNGYYSKLAIFRQ